MRRGLRGKSKGRASGGRPPGLKGKDIGLYYKQKHSENVSSADETETSFVRPPGPKGKEVPHNYKQKNAAKLSVDERRSSEVRPPGLKGRELGYYYRDKQREKSGVKPFVRRLKVPEAAVAALKADIKSIEKIAIKKDIYLEPVKELKFVKPNTDGADFIPLQASDSEKEYHHVTNIFPKDNDVIYVSKDSFRDDDDVIFVTTATYDLVSDDEDLIEVTSSEYDSKILVHEDIDTTPTAKKAKANYTALDLIIDTDIQPGKSDIKPCHKLRNDTVSSTVPDSDLDGSIKIKAEIEPVSGCSSTNINGVMLLDDNDDTEPSTFDDKQKKGTVSSQGFYSMANKEMKAEIEPIAGCSSININDTMLHDDIEPSTSDDKPKESTVSSQLFHSMANKEIKAEIEPVAGCSTTNLNDMILVDDIKPSSFDPKPKKGTVASQLFHSMANKKMKAEVEPVNLPAMNGSSANIDDSMLLDDNGDDRVPSTSDDKPKEGTVSSTFLNSIANKEMKADIDPVAGCSSTISNNMILVDDNDDGIKPSTYDDKPKKGTVSNHKMEPVASCSSTKLNDVILIDDNDEDVILVQSDYEMSETNSRLNNHAESVFSQKDYHTAHKDFKYGYEDIVTGKFEDKLDESLAKGIDINIQNDKNHQLSKDLLDDYNIMVENPKYKEMKQFREILPAYKMAQELLDVVNNNQVIVISGETGCGKSTQVPQIILDDALINKRGANVKIFVTEPRRIAASSLAMRIAEERGEPTGKSVGYAVRLERVECRPRGSIMFCTTGVLLVELETNQSLSNFTHIILDEVHERDCQIDISMCMLRQVLKKRKDLKLILMSATIDSESLSAYFDNCPMLHITGLAYMVKDIYLEEILHMTRYKLPPVNDNPHGRPEKVWMTHLKDRKAEVARETEKEIRFRAEIGPWLESIRKLIDRDVYLTLQDCRIEDLNVKLIYRLLLCITRNEPGAILVFLPGIADITKLIRLMEDSRMFPSSHFEIHPLHSKLPTLTQHKIFRRPPKDIRKIIVATNIAETSITIDDIVYVVDSAKVKFKGLNVKDHVTTLQTEWASQANLRQRRGRAGRCQPGICYHLVTSYRASQLEERPLPELQRDALLEAVLQIKRLRLGLAAPALAMMPAPPHETTINNAIRHLQQCGALDQRESLTPLGWHLARLPVHPAAGKLLLFGALFGCLERAACVAAVWGFKDPFNLVIGKEKQVDEAKKHLALGEPSDHIAISEALMQWDNFETHAEKYDFARQFFLSMNNLKLLTSMKQQFGENLKQMGFLRSGNVKSSWENRNTDNLALFKAIVAAALYPNIGVVRWKKSPNNPYKHPYITVKTTDSTSVQIHPSSVMSNKEHHYPKNRSMPLCARPGANWLVYWLKQRSTSLYLLDVTLVYTLPLLFFGELNVTQGDNRDECRIDINTVKVCCDRETTLLLFRLRSFLDQVLASKIMASGEMKRSSKFEEHVLNAVINLITAEDARSENIDGDDISDSDDFNDGKAWY